MNKKLILGSAVLPDAGVGAIAAQHKTSQTKKDLSMLHDASSTVINTKYISKTNEYTNKLFWKYINAIEEIYIEQSKKSQVENKGVKNIAYIAQKNEKFKKKLQTFIL